MNMTRTLLYVLTKVSVLRRVGVTDATPVQYDPVAGCFEILDFSEHCPEWVVRDESVANACWQERLAGEYGVACVALSGCEVEDFSNRLVKVTSAGMDLLFTAGMRGEYERVMAALSGRAGNGF